MYVATKTVMVTDDGVQRFVHAGGLIPAGVPKADIDRLLAAGLIAEESHPTTGDDSAKPTARPQRGRSTRK